MCWRRARRFGDGYFTLAHEHQRGREHSSLTPGQSDTFTATVTVPADDSLPTGGVVTFLDNGVAIGSSALVNGKATLNTSTLSLGSHHITASYSGITGYAPSLSGVEPSSVVSNVVWGIMPNTLAIDASGDVFYFDNSFDEVIELKPNGISAIVVPTGLNDPQGLAVDGSGDVLIADTGNNRVVEGHPGRYADDRWNGTLATRPAWPWATTAMSSLPNSAITVWSKSTRTARRRPSERDSTVPKAWRWISMATFSSPTLLQRPRHRGPAGRHTDKLSMAQ